MDLHSHAGRVRTVGYLGSDDTCRVTDGTIVVVVDAGPRLP